jgi:hypothetical protein
MPFTKVVEQCKIYNFGIQMFVHFSSKILRKTRQNSARPSWVGTLALQSARARAGVAVAAPRSAGSARRGRSLVRQSMRRSQNRHATALLSQSAHDARPRRTAQPTAAPPYTASAHARRCRSTAHVTPCTASPRLGVQANFPTISTLGYKSTSPSFTRGSTTPPGRHCHRLRCHGEPRAPVVLLPKPCYQYLP